MIGRIYSLLLLSLSPDIGILESFGVLENLCLLQELVISTMPRSWWFQQEVVHPFSNPSRLQWAQESSGLPFHIPASPLQKPHSSFPSPRLKKTGKYPAPYTLRGSTEPSLSENTWSVLGLPSWENQECLFGFNLGEKAKKAEQTCECKFGTCLTR